MNKNITIREYREGDEVSIMKLRGLVLSGPKDMDWWLWQHRQKPAGRAITVIAEDKDKKVIIGHFCYWLQRVKIEDSICLIVSSVDNMVHPDYRGLGIYSQLRKKIHEIARQNNIRFTYNFPNEITGRIGTRIVETKPIFKRIPLWIRPLQVENIITRYFKRNNTIGPLLIAAIKGIAGIIDKSKNHQIRTKIREVKEIDERFDSLWEKASSMYKIMIVRDRAYLNWRYVKKPDAEYTLYVSERDDRLLGYIVLRSVEDDGLRIGWIVDILTSPGDMSVPMDLIAQTIQHFRMLKTDIVLCVMPPKAHVSPILRRNGFLYSYKWLRKLMPIRIAPIPPGHNERFFYNSANWYLTKGDSDVI